MICKADRTAADRVLKAAVREAVNLLRGGAAHRAESVMQHAGHAAGLLIDERVAS